MTNRTGVIADIVGSRALADRAAAQAIVRECFARAHTVAIPDEPLWATVGDEFQAVYFDVASALRATTLVRTLLPDGVDCRFGIGEGEIRTVESAPTTGHPIQDGSAWWNARAAIDELHRMQERDQPELRTWFVGADTSSQALVNAFLVDRDHTISRMKSRERRLAGEYLSGRTQQEIARAEQISQSAVSQNLRRSGATALGLGMTLLRAQTPDPAPSR